MRADRLRTLSLALLMTLVAAGTGRAQNARDSARIVAGAAYAAGPLHRFLLGDHYRDLWTTPLTVPVLDLDTFAGGLTPLKTGGGLQTRSLRFQAGNGRQYAFRSVDKDPSAVLPADLRETLVDRIFQDQISSSHPAGALVVARLLDAVGVLHAQPRLEVMPDDPRLGQFRTEFHGMLGTIEERPDEGSDTLPGFMGASQIVSTERMLKGVEEDLEQLDARAFLKARLVDAFLGDWDRHRDQWRWARFGETIDSAWRPIPRDRDQAFVRLDGFLLRIARQYYPQLQNFGASYANPVGLMWNGRELDRRLLSGLDRAAWDSVTLSLQAQLTDAAIDSAVSRLPGAWYTQDGERLRQTLRARRGALPDYADRFYRMLASEVEVHTTDAAETATVQRAADGSVTINVSARQHGAQRAVFHRRFLPGETKEVRLYLQGGADSVRVTGEGGPIGLRITGGGGDDVLSNASRGGVHFYDWAGHNTFVRGPGTHVTESPWLYAGPAYPPSQPPRDWGRLVRYSPWLLRAPDVGFQVGWGVNFYDYGFRAWPWASHFMARAAFGTGPRRLRAELTAQFNHENSRAHTDLSARVSGLDVLRFYGFGNETGNAGDRSAFLVDQTQLALNAGITAPLGARASVSAGPELRYTDTDAEPGRLITVLHPYGSGSFGQAGLRADFQLDARDHVRAATRGAALALGAALWPALWSVRRTYGDAHGQATAFLSAPLPFHPTLALRLGGRKLWGTLPYANAAYIGDESTVRLGLKQRYAGDAEAHANAELRLRLFRALLVLPADFGVFGLYDSGRVWYAGESSRRWHQARGGGFSIAFLRPENTLSLAITHAESRTGLYFGAGFAY